ncbi:unnamed protein product [Linum trigynum]|uniref:Uncharacterized protein n=1 Tax=Linum trigynum TaxID=586398 RepID=A0AAV2DG70_9ROSI
MVKVVTTWNISESLKATRFDFIFKVQDRGRDLCVPDAIFIAVKVHHVRNSIGETFCLLLGCLLKSAVTVLDQDP